MNRPKPSIAQLREDLKKKLLDTYKEKPCPSLPHEILKSPVYQELQKKIRNGSFLQENDIIWDELEKIVIQVSPDFLTNLRQIQT